MARRFFYDTEFIEKQGSIDLISIGVVGDDGSEFYAINADCDLDKANDCVKENVICHLPPKRYFSDGGFDGDIPFVNQEGGSWFNESIIASNLLEYLKPSKDDRVEMWGYF